MNFIRNRNFRAGPQTSLEGFICPQNSDKQQKIKVFGRSGGGNLLYLYFCLRKDDSIKNRKEPYERALSEYNISGSMPISFCDIFSKKQIL